MQTIEQIIDYCETYSVSPRTRNTFSIEVGKKISKYLLKNCIYSDYFYHGLATFFYGQINNDSVIVTKEMFCSNKYYKECYNIFVNKNNIRCINCIHCYNCSDCIDCIDCTNCVGCEHCNLCLNCTLCINCLKCDHCIQSKYLSVSSSLNNENSSLTYIL